MAEADIILDHLTKRFGDVIAVNDVSIEVQRGEFLSVIGPSGCGKTTTMRMIAGLEAPTSGEILIRGDRVANVPAYKRNVAMVFQTFALFPHMSVMGNAEYGLRMKRVDKATRRARAKKALETVGLGGLENRSVDQLSGGQKQRLGLARALAVDPAFVLLDEPLGSLDPTLRVEIQAELKQLQRDMGITFIHVSHNQAEALAMADRIVVMAQGRFEQIGTPTEVYATPRTRFVAGFVGKNNLFHAAVDSVEGDLVRATTPEGVFTLKTTSQSRPASKEIWFVVRAEVVRPAEVDAGVDNTITATVAGLEYTGSVVTVTLVLPGGREIKMEQHESLSRADTPTLGGQLTVGWRSDETYILPG